MFVHWQILNQYTRGKWGRKKFMMFNREASSITWHHKYISITLVTLFFLLASSNHRVHETNYLKKRIKKTNKSEVNDLKVRVPCAQHNKRSQLKFSWIIELDFVSDANHMLWKFFASIRTTCSCGIRIFDRRLGQFTHLTVILVPFKCIYVR